ncbi:hypothetical protein [Variovorax sp. W6]|uniref:hypothetical protein n=1 Tax=Variovorax sp. W6 TaxID=3093895 RepID=UPI003D8043AC
MISNDGKFSGKRVRLISFLGKPSAPSGVKVAENYWILIGNSGMAICNGEGVWGLPGRSRYLVQFERNVESLGLHCHNEITNALWVEENDIELVLGGLSRMQKSNSKLMLKVRF